MLLFNTAGEVEVITLNGLESSQLFGEDTSVTESDIDIINMVLYIKDRHSVSGSAYHEFTQVCKLLPRSYKIKERIAELNRKWDIKPTPSGTAGVQQSLKERLYVRVVKLIEQSPSNALFRTNKRFFWRWNEIGKKLHVVHVTSTLLDEGAAAYSSDGNHPIAIFKEPEDYESLEKCLSDILTEMSELSAIEVNGESYEVEYFLGGDMKFLAIATGIDSASSTYSCVWCKCPAYERFDASMEWSATNPEKGARTVEESTEIAALPKSKRKFNVSHKPLFQSIPIDHVVIDNLHLFLRIFDTLHNLLITDLKKKKKPLTSQKNSQVRSVWIVTNI